MKKTKKRKIKHPDNIDANGEHNSCMHLSGITSAMRFQVNANDVFYTNDIKLMRRIAKKINALADYAAQVKRDNR